ncbi:MAG: hypothetical protein RR290_02370 [Clostridia bacterium]
MNNLEIIDIYNKGYKLDYIYNAFFISKKAEKITKKFAIDYVDTILYYHILNRYK